MGSQTLGGDPFWGRGVFLNGVAGPVKKHLILQKLLIWGVVNSPIYGNINRAGVAGQKSLGTPDLTYYMTGSDSKET